MAGTIQEFVDARGIKSLFHFTRVDNLRPILESGLLTREACDLAGIKPVINDHYRYDGTGAISATISYPNYRMFYSLRCGSDAEWVVLKLKRSLLWRTRCAFRSGSGCLNNFPRFISGIRADHGRCGVVHGTGRRLQRSDRRDRQLGAHRGLHLKRPSSSMVERSSTFHPA